MIASDEKPHDGLENFDFAVAHEEMNPRRRNTMEDAHRILRTLHPELPHFSFFGLYDGHGGRQIVSFLEENLEKQLAEEIMIADEASIEEKITRAFLITDMKSRQLEITTSGATAVIALIHRSNDKRMLHVANVGDSRAVLVAKTSCNGGEIGATGFFAQRLSFDHRADDASEQKRIAESGGFVTRNRVLGILAVSRSFGDHGMKDFVIAEPFVRTVNLDEENSPILLILACDGVWDVLSDEEASELLLEHFKKHCGPFQEAAQILVEAAIEKGSSDNVTAVVIFL